MTDHLPECQAAYKKHWPCICVWLRACEARVIDAFLASDTMKVIRSGESEHGYHAALDAVLELMKLYEYEADYCTAIPDESDRIVTVEVNEDGLGYIKKSADHACDLEAAIDNIREKP